MILDCLWYFSCVQRYFELYLPSSMYCKMAKLNSYIMPIGRKRDWLHCYWINCIYVYLGIIVSIGTDLKQTFRSLFMGLDHTIQAVYRETFKLMQDKPNRKKSVYQQEWGWRSGRLKPCYTGLWSGEACVAVTDTHSVAVSLVLRRPMYSLSSRLAVSLSVSSAVMVCGP